MAEESMEMEGGDADDEESFLISLELMGGEITGESYSIIVRFLVQNNCCT